MEILFVAIGLGLIISVLWEGFETIVLPRRVTRRFRLTPLFYRYTWVPWSTAVRKLAGGKQRESYLSYYGPLSLLLLLSLWVGGMIVGFALLYRATGSSLYGRPGEGGFLTDLYLSGTTFFTLGIGDVTPHTPMARLLTVIEAGMGFAFLAIIIGYLPALNQSFSRREVSISLLDERAGSPPSAAEMLLRHNHHQGMAALQQLLYQWERWAAELLESHLSYPVLGFFRSQHDNQSWLAALTAILDTCAIVMVGLEGACQRQAELTFAIARHAVVDLSLVFRTPPRTPRTDRLPPEELAALRAVLAEGGLTLRGGNEADQRLVELRRMYEPYVAVLAAYLNFNLPPWHRRGERRDNWQASAWDRHPRAARSEHRHAGEDDHF